MHKSRSEELTTQLGQQRALFLEVEQNLDSGLKLYGNIHKQIGAGFFLFLQNQNQK